MQKHTDVIYILMYVSNFYGWIFWEYKKMKAEDAVRTGG